ncbi:S49 family peptidase [Hansschlegelia beijingensis]|uniref:S49 family peptidase n=1 Tax=Hansschlegelia beijingensis TaxID=1133344 RepID=UPI00387F2E3C
MRIDLTNVAGRLFNTPLMMHRARLDTALAALGPRLLEGFDPGAGSLDRPSREAALPGRRLYASGGYLADGGIGILPIVGTTVRRGSWLDAACGLVSYGLIRQGFDEMLADPNVRGVLLEFDTPGGEAGGCFDLARHLRSAARAAGKPVWAHVNELAASAGYALASAADEIWIATTGEAGSIGVLAAHLDVTAADAKAGLKWTFIHEGARKVNGNPHVPLSSEAEKAIRADVSSLYGMFVELVAELRPKLSAAAIRGTESETFRGAEAVKKGLADKMGTIDTTFGAFVQHLDKREAAQPAAVREAGRAAVEAARLAVARQVLQSKITAAVSVEHARAAALSTIGLQAAKYGVDFDVAVAIERGVTPEAARISVMTAAAERDEATMIFTMAPIEGARSGRSVADGEELWRRVHRRR